VSQAATELEQFFDMSIDLLCVVGFDGYFKRVNPAWERLLGYSREELLERMVFDVTHPDDVEPAREALGRLADGSDLVGFTTRVVTADGDVRWVEWNTRTVPEHGVVYGVGRDATERRQAEAALRGAHAQLETGRDELRALADQQAALRRVATLVAQETATDAVFAAVTREVGQVLGVDAAQLGRFDPDGTVVSVAQWGRYPGVALGARFPLDGDSVSARVLRTGQAARMDRYDGVPGSIAATLRALGIRFAVGVPVAVTGRTWGVMTVTTKGAEPFGPDTESRLQDFTDLLATAIANAEARAEVARLAEEQSALRRVATLVAQGAPPPAVFDAATAEVSRLVGASSVTLARFDDDGLIVLAHRASDTPLGIGERVPVGSGDLAATVARTGRTARRDDAGSGSTVAAPIVVDGRTWGVLAASWTDAAPPEDTEERVASFAALLDTAIANADGREQLTASRARVLAGGDDGGGGVVGYLHDGAQQRLVHTIVTLKLALAAGGANAEPLLAEALENAERANAEVRELAHGILPSGLTRGGLQAGVRDFVTRLELPVDVEIATGRLARDVEASAYFIVAEALTNVVKHAHATHATVRATVEDGGLRIEVADDGRGGADPQGYGLLGIADRVSALGGRLDVAGGARGGTVVVARLPLSR
jgi:PAS domain S-box-containing protein